MRRGDVDGLHGLRIEPAVAAADAAKVQHADIATDDGQLELVIEWSSLDLAPFEGAHKAEQD